MNPPLSRLRPAQGALLAFLLAFTASCGDSPTGNPPVDKPAPVARIDVSSPSPQVPALDSLQLSAVPRDAAGTALAGRTIQWSSNNTNVARVDASGRVSGEAPGTATLTATSEGSSGSVTLTVLPPRVASLTLARDTATIRVGGAVVLAATARDRNGAPLVRGVSWTSGSPGVATVDVTGVVTGVAPGVAVLTGAVDAHTVRATITVVAVPIASLALTPESATLTAGSSQQMFVLARDASGNVLTGRGAALTTSNPAVASLEPGGVVRAVSPGIATITATAEGKTAQATISVVPGPVATVTVSASASTVLVGNTVVVNAVARDASGNMHTAPPVVWSSTNPSIATVSDVGVVTGVAPGLVVITGTVAGRMGTTAITVQPRPIATLTITPASVSLTVGGAAQLTAVARDAEGNVLTGRGITWFVVAPGVATVSASGLVTAHAAGVAQVRAIVEGLGATAQVTVTAPASVQASTTAGLTIQPVP